MINVLSADDRRIALGDIAGDENKRRKNESLKKYDIYQKRQLPYLRERLINEYSRSTVEQMRLISSINLCRRITDEKASLYNRAPVRNFYRSGGSPLGDNELAQLNAIYKESRANEVMKKANRYFKLQNQCAINVVPKDGRIMARVLQPHHYDVIPRDDDPERAYAYIISVYDRSLLYNFVTNQATSETNYQSQPAGDQINQTIADADDYKKKAGQRFIWWTDEYNFITDGYGNIIDAMGRPLENLDQIRNPIGMLPFIDVATGRDYEFWVRSGNDAVDFSLDFSVMISDNAEINKRQGYSQAIFYSEEPPKDMSVGPHRVLHVKQDPNKELQPKFEWSTPSPDLQASLELLKTSLILYLSSEGMDTKTVRAEAAGADYSSGIERLLSMVQKFEASADDADMFGQYVEHKYLKLVSAWSNLLQGAFLQDGVEPLIPELQQSTIHDDVAVNVEYLRPEALQSKSELEASVMMRMENGLMSRADALVELEGLEKDDAIRRVQEIDQEEMRLARGENSEGEV